MKNTEKMEILLERIYEDHFFDTTMPIYHGLSLLITIGNIHIYRIGKTTFQINFWKFNINLYTISAVIKYLKTERAIKYYLTH